MNCLICELTRARAKAAIMHSVGLSQTRIATHLSKTYGENYYVEGKCIMRASKLPPFNPYEIHKES